MSRKRCRLKKPVAAALMTLLLLAAGFGVYFAGRLIEKATYPVYYREYVEKYAEKNSLEPAVVLAVIKSESSFRPNVVSSAGAIGLMQIMPRTAGKIAEHFGGEFSEDADLYDPETNIMFGCALLRWMSDEFGDTDTVIAAYNAGWGNVKKWLEDEAYSTDGATLHTIPFKETENFVRRVNAATEKYRELYYGG